MTARCLNLQRNGRGHAADRALERFGMSGQDRGDRVVASDPGRATLTLRGLAPDAQLGIDATALEERIARRLQSVASPRS
jgi:hypothetical protein